MRQGRRRDNFHPEGDPHGGRRELPKALLKANPGQQFHQPHSNQLLGAMLVTDWPPQPTSGGRTLCPGLFWSWLPGHSQGWGGTRSLKTTTTEQVLRGQRTRNRPPSSDSPSRLQTCTYNHLETSPRVSPSDSPCPQQLDSSPTPKRLHHRKF